MNFRDKTYIMGILNVTPDSFSDGGNFDNLELAMKQVDKMILSGVDIIDIGGESTRPDSQAISVETEIERIVPIIREIRKKYNVLISLDTYKSEVAEAGINAGANIINDVSGALYDEKMLEIVRKNNVPIILMHNRFKGTPHATRKTENYKNVVSEVVDELKLVISNCISKGVNQIIVDPGIGFAKTKEDNLILLNKLDYIKENLKYPLLLGTSRKRFIGDVLNLDTDSRLEGTLATTVFGIMKGANIIRCHDVLENKRVAKMTDAIIKK